MYFKVTLTTSGGFEESHLETISSYFSDTCSECYVVNEQGQNHNSHVECVAKYETEKTSNVTTRMKNLYSRLSLEVSYNSIRVKKATHLIGALIYANKEVSESGVVLAIKGFKQTWIDTLVKDHVKDIPRKMLRSKGTRLSQQTAGAMIHEYAIVNNMVVTNKEDYRIVCVLMANDGYLFGSIRHIGVYQDVTALFGYGHAVGDVIANVLNFY